MCGVSCDWQGQLGSAFLAPLQEEGDDKKRMVGKREERKEGVDGGVDGGMREREGAKTLNNWKFCHSVADNNPSRKERTGQGKEKEKEEEEARSCSSCSSQLTAQKSILLRLRLAPHPRTPATIPPSREREARKGKYYVFTKRPPLRIFLKQTRPAPTWP